MSQDIRPGQKVPIPCRVCVNTMPPLTEDWGRHLLSCLNCGKVTQVAVREERGTARIRTQKFDL